MKKMGCDKMSENGNAAVEWNDGTLIYLMGVVHMNLRRLKGEGKCTFTITREAITDAMVEKMVVLLREDGYGVEADAERIYIQW